MPYYHVRIMQKSGGRGALKLDFTHQELEQRVLEPYRKGRPITISGKSIVTDDIERVVITTTEQLSSYLRPIAEQKRNSSGVIMLTPLDSDILGMGENVTDKFITASPGSEFEAGPLPIQEPRPTGTAREVFVVHGRNDAARDALFDFLRAIDLHPLEWSEAVQSAGKPSPYIGEILDAAFSRARAVVVLFTPDDEARLSETLQDDSDPPHETELTGQARPNVLFEAGMAMSRSEARTILVELGVLRPFSDIGGRHVIRVDNSSQRRQELAQRLETAGCPVNLDGTDWFSAGDFDAAVARSVQESSESTAVLDQPPHVEPTRLSEDARRLLIQAAKGKNGMIRKVRTAGGLAITSNNESFTEMGDRRSEAKWERAIQAPY